MSVNVAPVTCKSSLSSDKPSHLCVALAEQAMQRSPHDDCSVLASAPLLLHCIPPARGRHRAMHWHAGTAALECSSQAGLQARSLKGRIGQQPPTCRGAGANRCSEAVQVLQGAAPGEAPRAGGALAQVGSMPQAGAAPRATVTLNCRKVTEGAANCALYLINLPCSHAHWLPNLPALPAACSYHGGPFEWAYNT